jgi:hypothetical protein
MILFEDFNESKTNDVSQNNSKKDEKEEDYATESEYEFSDVDDEETQIVNKLMAKATNKLKRNRQTKKYIHITTTY